MSSSVNMRRLAQFVRLASRVSRLCASVCVSRLASCLASRVCVRLVLRLSASASCLASVCILSCVLSRVWLSLCVCVSRLSVCVRLASRVSRLSASRVCLRLASCLASVCLLVNACGDWLILCVGRHSKSLKGCHTIAVHIDYVDYMNRPLIF